MLIVVLHIENLLKDIIAENMKEHILASALIRWKNCRHKKCRRLIVRWKCVLILFSSYLQFYLPLFLYRY